jgi:rhamnose transport system permease protein
MRVLLRRYSREASVAAAYAALLALLAWQAPRYYQQQFASVWVSIAPVLVLATGMTLVILARHIDISIGWQLSVCGVVAGLLARQGVPMPAVVAITLTLGAVMGAFNGALVAFMGLPSIVVTLATMVILRQGLAWVRQGEAVYGLPADFQWFGQTQAAGQFTLVVVALGLFGAFAWGLRWLAAGRAVYAVGSDHEAARLAGIRPHRVVFGGFVLMGALAGLAAMLQSVRSPQVDPNAGKDLELQVIAAVVVGGVAISGGRGTLVGVLLGVALLGTIGSALVFLDVHSTWQRALEGLIILIAVSSDVLRRRAAP